MDMNKIAANLSHRTTFVAWIATMLLSFSTAAKAADLTLDTVVAVVNKDIILDSEVRTLAQQLRSANSEASNTLLLRNALDGLISEKLQLQAAKRAGINPDKASIDKAVNTIATRNDLSLSDFKQALQKQGVNYQTFRETITKQMIINSLKQRRTSQNSEVSEQEINDLITAESKQITENRDYHIQTLTIASPENASISGYLQAKDNAFQLRKLALTSKDFMKVKTAGSRVKDWGWQPSQQLSFPFLSELTKLEREQISKVISDANGFHILKLVDHRGGKEIKSTQVKVRHILISSNQPDAKSKIDSIRQQIVQGEDFAYLAKANSDDTGSAINEGDLGWSDSKRYVPEFAKASETLPINTLSPVIKTEFGFHILEVLDRKQTDASRRALETQARKLIQSKKQEQDYDAWVQGLRSSAFIEIKQN